MGIMQKDKTVEAESIHAGILISTVVIVKISLELEPQLPQDAPLCVSHNEMMLFGVCNLIENKARAAHILEFRVDLDFNGWQSVRAKDGILTCPLDKCHHG